MADPGRFWSIPAIKGPIFRAVIAARRINRDSYTPAIFSISNQRLQKYRMWGALKPHHVPEVEISPNLNTISRLVLKISGLLLNDSRPVRYFVCSHGPHPTNNLKAAIALI
ncbi:unnamed protein product, partial [Iphiclides podalirius]